MTVTKRQKYCDKEQIGCSHQLRWGRVGTTEIKYREFVGGDGTTVCPGSGGDGCTNLHVY